ncbi:MAG: beta-lactamase family protein [Actinobacteria bacterium]|jgi:CubicO group peptidase (beta-lactamase class C family)|nr:beta-lactamase family protein [Acidimicrobiaceae bacterium]MBP7888041.1 beta-lactamase family protein [Ilumatobacteraceae bacterium]NMD24956.1 beta-lactamase family protein [Actinomycetota bacterium]MBK9970704.1 beta-lactamase family protein [Acidimicrobiaceae bacterium]MBP8208034.1 beta-lactamase family protein [Ilumatobacteraceae bacterium]
MDTPISGHCDPRYASVRDAFEGNFLERGEVGAAVCVMVRGEAVVDLVGGWADEARTQLWRRDTLVNFYSVGKAIVALLALQLVDDGSVGLDDPIASVWPEFAAGGKQRATIREALCHRAGVPAIRERLTDDDLWDWQRMADALAATDPWFEPGSRHIYHTNTYGHLVGEIVRRVTGELPGARLRRLTEPLAADVHWGLTSDQQARCADVIWAPSAPLGAIDPFTIEGDAHLPMLGYFNPPGYSSNGVVNTAEWRAAQVPSTNGHGTAVGLARLYGAIIEPHRLLSPALLAEATRVQSEGPCPVLGEDVAFGLGFVPTSGRRPLGTNSRSFGHFGTGGALGFGDPDAGVSFGYVMNHVIPRWQSTRNRTLIDAVYAAL